jgi:4-hydroxybenzoate polyprenyltransferase
MVFFGIMLTRYLLGGGRVKANLTFGPLIFFLLAMSGMFSVLVLRVLDNQEKKLKEAQKYLIIGGIAYVIAFGLSIYHSVKYDLGFIPILTVILIGGIEGGIILYGKTWKYQSLIHPLWNSFLPAFGFFYGAMISGVVLPVYVYLLFLTVFVLQLAKDIVKKYKTYQENKGGDAAFIDQIGSQKIQKGIISLLLFSMVCLLIPEFLNLPNSFLFLYGMLFELVLLGFAAVLIFKVDLGEHYKKIINILLKFGIFVQYLTFFLGSV